MRALPLAIVILSLLPAAGALPSPIPTECRWVDPVTACASDSSDGCYGSTTIQGRTPLGLFDLTGTDACGFRTLALTGSSPLTGFYAFRVEGTDSSCTASGAFVVNVVPTTDCSAVGAPPSPGWGQLLP